jgi:hypothetical protein
MTLRSRAVAVALLIGTAPAAAQSAKAPLSVSVQVTRSCRVAGSHDQVAVACGRRPVAVQVVTGDGKGVPQSIEGTTPISRRPGEPVTINF